MAGTNNPASRLHEILTEVLRRHDNLRMRTVWSQVFELDEQDTGQLLYYVWQLTELLTVTRRHVHRLENVDHALYLAPIEQIEKALGATHFDMGNMYFKQSLPRDVMTGLAFVADALSRTRVEEEVNASTLKDLLAEVDELFEQVASSSIAPSLKATLLDNLEQIRRAIQEFRLRGLTGLEIAVNGSFGAILRKYSEVKEANDSPETKPVMDRIMGVLMKAERVVTFGTKVRQLTEYSESVWNQFKQLLNQG